MSVIGTLKTTRLRPWVFAAVAPLVIGLSLQACSDGGNGAAAQPHARKAQRVVSINIAAAPVGQSKAGRSGLTPGLATFKPARPGRKVQVQAKVGKRWKVVTTTVQDKKGNATFNVPGVSKRKPVSYRVLAVKTKKDKQVVSKSVKSSNWKLTWGDEFSGSGALNPAIWKTWVPGRQPTKFDCSDVLAGNAYRQGGAANLKVSLLPGVQGAKTKTCPTGQFGNAMVAADSPEHHMKYGFAAARVKFSPARGQHSAFWLDVPDYSAITPGDASTGAEIDIAEYFGDDRPKGGLASFVHTMNKKGKWDSIGGEYKSRHLLPKKKEWSQGWHVYSVEWSPTGYIFRVDGAVTLKTSKSVSHVPEKVVLSSLTSMWEIPALKVSQLPSVTKYDWVRVWQRPGA
ncbi:hypothetical protein GCM10023350_48570 [Nocardioides endophyticus]|uniref:GH16 domain-containing protein n=1 Tax=Nocardioides endophyticus TaxID=1353775 RepID=A0ABP8ZHY2_9ACTN